MRQLREPVTQLRRLKRLRETGKNWKQVNNWHTPQLQLIHLFLSSIVLEPPATQGESELPHPLSDEGPQRVVVDITETESETAERACYAAQTAQKTQRDGEKLEAGE